MIDTYSFYSVCDELGVLAWSEFIFSDDIYHPDDWMLSSIKTEVQQNVRRVNKHPSVAEWAGSNEIEVVANFLNQSDPRAAVYIDEVCGTILSTSTRALTSYSPVVYRTFPEYTSGLCI